MIFESDANQLLAQISDVSELLRTNAAKVDQEGQWPKENISALKSAGLAGLLVPKELGGHGEGFLTMVQACEILGEACASTSMCYGMHLVGTSVMTAKATSYQKENYLRPIAEGKHWTTLSLSEPGTGSHFYIPQTKMSASAEGKLVINGQKSFVTNGGHADSYVASVVGEDEQEGMGEFSCVIIPGQSPGVKWGNPWEGIGMRGNSSRGLKLENVSIPAENLLGEVGEQLWYVFEVVAPGFLMAMSGTYLGIARAAVQEVVTHFNGRKFSHTGASLGSVPVLQHRLGQLWGELEATRQLVYSAASLLDQSSPSALLSVLVAKAQVADTVVKTVNESMTLMGGQGFAHAGAMERHLRDARAAHVMSPTTDILRTWAGRALVGTPLLGD